MYYGANTVIFQNAKQLRNNMTETESKLWERLAKNKLKVRFKPQHPIASFVADFYCHKAKLIVEVDGGTHYTKDGKEQDALRTNELERLGLLVIRFSNSQVLADIDSVIAEISEQIKERLGKRVEPRD